MKYDGMRVIARIDRAGARLFSRNLREVSASFPEIVAALGSAPQAMLLDGEVVTPAATGSPSFSRLQQRMHVAKPTPELIAAVRADYLVFDLLGVADAPLMAESYLRRRELLEGLDIDDGARIRVPPRWPLSEFGADTLLQVSAEHGLEGAVFKRGDSIYEPGRRSAAWTKVVTRYSREAIIVGVLPGRGANAATIGSLVLACYDRDGLLRYVGSVGSGLTTADRRHLHTELRRIRRDTSPVDGPPPASARAAWWVEPETVVDVECREITSAGTLRHPSYRGLRPDRSAEEVRWL